MEKMHEKKKKKKLYVYTKNSLFKPHSWRGSQNKNYDTICKGYLFIYLFILCLFRKYLLSRFMCTLSEKFFRILRSLAFTLILTLIFLFILDSFTLVSLASPKCCWNIFLTSVSFDILPSQACNVWLLYYLLLY